MPEGKQIEKGAWGSFVHSEFRSWPLNKLALLRWAALTMMYGRNTIHCCYELVGSMRTMPAHTHAHAQKDTQAITSKCTGIDTHTDSSGRAKKYLPLFQTNSIFIQDICKLIKMANKDWRNMSHPSGLDTILSAALAMACLLLLCPFLSKSLLFSLMTFLHHLMPSCIPSVLPSFYDFLFLSLHSDSPSFCPSKGKHIIHDTLWKARQECTHFFPVQHT